MEFGKEIAIADVVKTLLEEGWSKAEVKEKIENHVDYVLSFIDDETE